MTPKQLSLLDSGPTLPEGFKYEPDWLSSDEERDLLGRFSELPFKAFEFQGYLGKRRIVSFGWQYDFNKMEIQRAEDMPAFLHPLRDRAAAFAGISPSELQHVLLTEYGPGATIGWHKDKAVFGEVVGISLAAPCVFRFRRKTGGTWARASFIAEPRSAYLLKGRARTQWEHSIPAVAALRYSVTFRNLRTG
jgi:alkylated DNA repair dioxygenase AlkB